MNEPIVILSLSQPKETEGLWHFTALRIKDQGLPKYLMFSTTEDSLRNYQSEVKEFIGSADIFIFKEDQSLNIIYESLGIKNNSIVSIKEIAMIMFPLAGKYELEDLAQIMDIKLKKRIAPGRFNVRLAWGVLQKCLEKALLSDMTYITDLVECTEGLKTQVFFRKMAGQIIKRYPDRPIRTGIARKSNSEENMFSSSEHVDPQEIPGDPEWIEKCFEAGGLLARNFPSYEHRAIQSKMARTLIKGFTEAVDIIIEAGTGTGKTLAYLIPSLWMSKLNKKKVMVATNTITLQEQIFFKDLPAISKILPFRFKTALLKGRSNYICLKSFKEQKTGLLHMSQKERLERAIILSWIQETETGDFGELTQIDIHQTGKRYGCDNRLCQPGECSFGQSCFYLEARKKAEDADLVVINHSLLLADIKTKNRVLPEYHDLIVDEAHNLYSTALRQLGFELSREQMVRLIEGINGDDRTSLLGSLERYYISWAEAFPDAKSQALEKNFDNISGVCLSILEQSRDLFRMIDSLLEGRTTFLLDDQNVNQDILKYFFLSIENLLSRLDSLTNSLEKIGSSFMTESEQFENIKYELVRYKSELTLIIDGLSDIVTDAGECRITYLEKTNTAYIKSCPLEVAPILHEQIFSKNNCTALISATLSVAGSFEYIAQDLGIDNYISLKLDSTFHYDEQMLFCVVNGLADSEREEVLVKETAAFLMNIAEVMSGRTLVLFTSHRFLRLVHYHLEKIWSSGEYTVLTQGINGNREKIIKDFMQKEKSMLMGTNSFWEGIDIPGDSLRCVVMVKLPFSSPETPIIKAKSRLLKERGGDPFNQLLLPEAVIRFKQGFGRLIRTKDDQGVVVLLDDRIIKKSYGKYFLKSLPISSYYKGDPGMVINEVAKWI